MEGLVFRPRLPSYRNYAPAEWTLGHLHLN